MIKKKVAFVSFAALSDGELKNCTDYKLRKALLDVLRKESDISKVVVVCNQLNRAISRSDFECTASSVMAFLSTYCGVAVDFRFADYSGNIQLMLPGVLMLDAAAIMFPAILGGKESWVFIGNSELDKQTAENFKIDYVELNELI